MSTDSVNELRRAAALMREAADDATNETGASDWYAAGNLVRSSGGIVAETSLREAIHIASWHPDVALAVAGWLEMQAGCVANYGPNAESPWVKPHTQMALAVARAFLQ